LSAEEEEKAFVFKIVVIGDGAVGKTSLIKQYTEGNFVTDYIKTIGAQFSKYLESFDEDMVKLFFWDIAGQSEFSFMRPTFYKGAKAGIMVFSLTDDQSFENLKSWYEDIQKLQRQIRMATDRGNKRRPGYSTDSFSYHKKNKVEIIPGFIGQVLGKDYPKAGKVFVFVYPSIRP